MAGVSSCAVPSAVAMSKVTPPGPAGALRLTVKVNVVMPAFPSFSAMSLMDRLGNATGAAQAAFDARFVVPGAGA